MNDTISPDAETGLRADQVAQKRAQGRQNVLDDRTTKSTAQILKDNVCTGRTTPPASPRRPRPCAACARSS